MTVMALSVTGSVELRPGVPPWRAPYPRQRPVLPANVVAGRTIGPKPTAGPENQPVTVVFQNFPASSAVLGLPVLVMIRSASTTIGRRGPMFYVWLPAVNVPVKVAMTLAPTLV